MANLKKFTFNKSNDTEKVNPMSEEQKQEKEISDELDSIDVHQEETEKTKKQKIKSNRENPFPKPKTNGLMSRINDFLLKYQRIKKPEIIFFTKNLYLMVKVGIPLASALNTLGVQTKNLKLQKIIIDIANAVEKGSNLFETVSKYPGVFSHFYRSMIEVGEVSGTLDKSLHNISEQEKKDYDLQKKIKGAMLYPIIILTAIVLLGIGTFIFVVPTFVSIFADLEADLPLATKILMAIAGFVLNYGIILLIVLILIIAGIVYLGKTEKGKRVIAKILINFPLIGNIIIMVNELKFARILHSLIITDIKIEQAFKITAKSMNNPLYTDALHEASLSVEKGEPISKSLQKYPKLFSNIIIQLISVGEDTGSLDEILFEIADFYENETDNIMKNLSSVIEPILILVLGVGVAFMAISVIMPMYSLSSHMSI